MTRRSTGTLLIALIAACACSASAQETQPTAETRAALERGDLDTVQAHVQAALHTDLSRAEVVKYRDELGYAFWVQTLQQPSKELSAVARRFLGVSTGCTRRPHDELAIAIAAVDLGAYELAANRLEALLSFGLTRRAARAYRDRAGYDLWRKALEHGGRLATAARALLLAAE